MKPAARPIWHIPGRSYRERNVSSAHGDCFNGPGELIMVGGLFKGRNSEPMPDIPADRLQRVQRSFRRRLSDQVEDVFHRACVEDDIQTAEDLYKLLECMQHRRQHLYAVERRLNNDGIVNARRALELCRIRNKHHVPQSDPRAGQVIQGAEETIDRGAQADSSAATAERHCPFYRYLMDHVGHVACSQQSNRHGAPYRAIGHYTFPADETINPPRRPITGT